MVPTERYFDKASVFAAHWSVSRMKVVVDEADTTAKAYTGHIFRPVL